MDYGSLACLLLPVSLSVSISLSSFRPVDRESLVISPSLVEFGSLVIRDSNNVGKVFNRSWTDPTLFVGPHERTSVLDSKGRLGLSTGASGNDSIG